MSGMGSCLAKEQRDSPKKMKIDEDCLDGKVAAGALVATMDEGIAIGVEADTGCAGNGHLPPITTNPVALSAEPVLETDLDEVTQPKTDEAYFEEASVGITEFIPSSNHNPGFKCIMKKRFSDFLVNEIDLNGQVVHLTDLSCPVSVNGELTPEESLEWLKEKLTDEQLDTITAMTAKKHDKKAFLDIDVDDLDKDERTKMHKCIKIAFKGKLFTQTKAKSVPATKSPTKMDTSDEVEVGVEAGEQEVESSPTKESLGEGQSVPATDERKFISVGLVNNWRGTSWAVPGKDYTTFTVYAEQRGTAEVLRTLSTMLNMSRKSFWVNGTKDKKSIAVQRVCGFHVAPERLVSISNHLSKHPYPTVFGN